MITIGFLGTGNMGTAIIKGILGSAMKEQVHICAYNPITELVDCLVPLGVEKCSSEAETAQKSDYLFLAIKPQVFGEVLPKIKDSISESTVIVSIAAGIDMAAIRRQTRADAKVVLVMPNTPLLLGVGATALSHDARTSEEEFRVVRSIFDATGITAVVAPEQMKEIIAVNSSSPAFLYLFAKGFLDYAEKVGLPADSAKALFAQTMIGSAKMITDSGKSIDELIRMVSSPGGTTLAGLDRLYEGNLTEVVGNACESCTKRAYELAQ